MERVKRPWWAAVLLAVALGAGALDLDEAKREGLVGETDSGYLAARVERPEVAALVAEINAERRREYERIARENGISLAAVEQLAARKAIERTPAGHYVRIGGQWRRK
ncbi:MAG: hypothetical protein KatS3mg124_2232 [Porticoccaceae bacterium]|nr:MAG: hypothetical protein KatS3mg124_2232 [Porticoccaceae bacterium]